MLIVYFFVDRKKVI